MLDYTQTLLTMQKYDNYLIPDIPKILTQFVINNDIHYLYLLDKKHKIDEILEVLSEKFKELEEISDKTILAILLEYLKIEITYD